MVGIAGDAILAQSSAFFTAGNAEVLANALCRLRGAALKLGQMLSIQVCVHVGMREFEKCIINFRK
jgi:hypothetical protein